MGEKGNITSDELAAVASATAESGGAGAVIAGAGTTVTAVFEESASTVRDKVIDKTADAGISTAQESWRSRSPRSVDDEADPESTEQTR